MKFVLRGLLVLMTVAVCPAAVIACACGCGVFDIGTSSMFPTQTGGMTFIEYDYMDQNDNWSGTKSSAAANNGDKEIRTNFFTVGTQYTFNRSWTLSGEAPLWNRHFETFNDPDLQTFNHSALGDVRLKATYTGLSEDFSTGLTFGVKLPTGDDAYPNFDPDTEISSGSYDVLLGGYHDGAITSDGKYDYFVNGEADLPVFHLEYYRPGKEYDAAVGGYYNGWKIGRDKLAPLLQLVGSVRTRDGAALGVSNNSGYERILLTPGLELHAGSYRIYTDVGLPIYQNVIGNQLTAKALYKINISHTY